MPGTLYLVATPIGNLEDITLRALRVLKEVDLIACEDTRHTRKLLAHYNISTPTVSYHEHNERERAAELVAKLEAGTNVAVVSDAGTPLVSDPGFRIVREAINRGIAVTPIPGPSALLAALAASGLPTNEFLFGGFLPPRRAARLARLRALADAAATLVFYEAPHRIQEALADAREALGDRQCVLARELTKMHEEFLRGSLSEVYDRVSGRDMKGEMVLLIGPPLADNQRRPAPVSIAGEVEALMQSRGLDRKDALKQVARSLGISKSEAYRRMLAEQSESNE
ncbi:MAG TPA: 16S rRNA (cytidine(1402)-2'-O)-methyltransferase [Blastocatellia bacterium]|nr:16S rRNA (cytidine(1402)-2'-O)-methyltransferase [Blastocatellia bacterium]